MNHSKHHNELGETAACTNRMIESTKGIGKKSINGGTKDCFFIVGSPTRRRKKL